MGKNREDCKRSHGFAYFSRALEQSTRGATKAKERNRVRGRESGSLRRFLTSLCYYWLPAVVQYTATYNAAFFVSFYSLLFLVPYIFRHHFNRVSYYGATKCRYDRVQERNKFWKEEKNGRTRQERTKK